MAPALTEWKNQTFHDQQLVRPPQCSEGDTKFVDLQTCVFGTVLSGGMKTLSTTDVLTNIV